MTKTPGETRPAAPPEHDVLEELGDDAIIAQQAAVHSPQPRAQIAIESRSIVIAEDQPDPPREQLLEGEPTRELVPYAVSSVDPTVVIRDRKFIDSLGKKREKPASSSNVGKIAMWGGAGVAAFAIGGVLAVLTARRAPAPREETPSTEGSAAEEPAEIITVVPPPQNTTAPAAPSALAEDARMALEQDAAQSTKPSEALSASSRAPAARLPKNGAISPPITSAAASRNTAK